MKEICIQYHKTKIGELILGSFADKLCLLDFNHRKMRKAVDHRIKKGLNADFIEKDSNIIQKTRIELDEYIQGNRREFDVPIQMVGSDFQKSVWNTLLKVPYGTTSTYLQLAKDINNKTTTSVKELNNDQRIEEIARMLSGSSITDEARRAAAKLLN